MPLWDFFTLLALFSAQLFTIFRRTDSYIFFKLFVKIINIFVAYLLGYFVYFNTLLLQQFLGMVYASVVYIGVKILTDCLCKQFTKIGTIIAKKRCN